MKEISNLKNDGYSITKRLSLVLKCTYYMLTYLNVGTAYILAIHNISQKQTCKLKPNFPERAPLPFNCQNIQSSSLPAMQGILGWDLHLWREKKGGSWQGLLLWLEVLALHSRAYPTPPYKQLAHNSLQAASQEWPTINFANRYHPTDRLGLNWELHANVIRYLSINVVY